jgi:hypothetical protein
VGGGNFGEGAAAPLLDVPPQDVLTKGRTNQFCFVLIPAGVLNSAAYAENSAQIVLRSAHGVPDGQLGLGLRLGSGSG